MIQKNMLHKISLENSKLSENDILAGTTVGGVGAYGGLRLKRPASIPLKPNAPITIVHTDRGRGSGHFAQGEALSAELTRQGIPNKLVNIDDFAKPGKLTEFNNIFKKKLNSEIGDIPYGIKAIKYYTKGIDWESFKKATQGTQIVNMHAGMDTFLQSHVDSPIYTVHTDQAPFKYPNPNFQNRMGSFSQHIATETAAPILAKEHPSLSSRISVISELPIKPASGSERILPTGKYNITLSGGGLGLGVDDQLEALLKTNLPSRAEIHVVTGHSGIKGNPAYDAQKLSRLNDLKQVAAKRGVQVNIYGFKPLRQMMEEADLNIMRPGGTTITEARATGKPFKLFLSDSLPKKDLSFRNTNAINTLYKPVIESPVFISESNVAPLEEFFNNMSKQKAGYNKLKVSPNGGASDIVKIIRSKVVAKNTPTAMISNKLGRLAAGSVAAASGGAYLTRNSETYKKWKKRKI